jgi:hypothetical protein
MRIFTGTSSPFQRSVETGFPEALPSSAEVLPAPGPGLDGAFLPWTYTDHEGAPMKKTHALAISLLLGLAVAAGALAATRGGDAPGSSQALSPASDAIAVENARLDRYEAALDRLIVRAKNGAIATGGTAPSTAPTSTVSSQSQSWDDDEDGDDNSEHGDDNGDDDSGHGSDDDGGHEDDD